MLTGNSPISEIALEAKDTSDDVRQIAMGIEASCKHVDNTVNSIKLGEVPKFVDDFPVPDITINPDMVGYGVDTEGIDYDIISIDNIYTVSIGDNFSFVRSFTTSDSVSEIFTLKDENFVTFYAGNSLTLYDGSTGDKLKNVSLDSGKNFSEHIIVDDVEYIFLRNRGEQKIDVYTADQLIKVKSIDAKSIANENYRRIYYDDGSLLVVTYDSSRTFFNMFNFKTTESEGRDYFSGNYHDATFIGDVIYVGSSNIIFLNRKTFNEIGRRAGLSGNTTSMTPFGDGKIFITNDNGYATIFDTKANSIKPQIFVTTQDYFRAFPDGSTIVYLSGSYIYRFDEDLKLVYNYNFNKTTYRASYLYPYYYTASNTIVQKYKDNATQKKVAKAQKRG